MPTVKTIRCALYSRVSTDRQLDPEGSLTSQLQRLREELDYRSRKDPSEKWVEAGHFVDEGKSGSTIEGRHEYRRMIAGVEAGKFDVVLAIELSRISRSIPDFCDFLNSIREHDCQFVAVNQPIDTTSLHGDLIAKIMVCIAEFERKITGARTKDSMAARARRGLFNGGQIPFGYNSDSNQKGYLVVDENAAPIVRDIFKKYLELGTYARVVAWLQQSGFQRPEYITTRKQRHKATRWTINHIKGLLSNETYIGVRVIGGRTRNLEGQVADSNKVKASWPAIIDKDLFQSVQTAIKKNARAGYCPTDKRQHTYLLSGVIRCAHCKIGLVGDFGISGSGTRYHYYVHPRGETKPDCRLPKRLRADRIDALAVERMDLLANDKGILDLTIKATQAVQAESVPAIEERIAARRRDLEAIMAEASAVLGSLTTLQAGKGAEFVQPKLNDLSERKQVLEEEIARQESALERAQASSFNPVEIQLLLRNAKAVMADLPPYQRKELVGMLVREASISPETFTMDMLGGQQWVAHVNAALAFVGARGKPRNDANKKSRPSDLFGWPAWWLPGEDSNLRPID